MTPFFITAFATLFVVVNPPGLVPMFIALTQGMTTTKRRAMAHRACLIAFILLFLFGIAGEALLGFIGISMPAFRIAGGLLLFLTALDMLFERARPTDQTDPDLYPSVFPLATPLIAGSGAITSMILLMGQSPNWETKLAVLILMALMMAVTYLFFLTSPLIERLLGRTGTVVVTRLLGMLLAALSVQFVIDGIRGTGLIGWSRPLI